MSHKRDILISRSVFGYFFIAFHKKAYAYSIVDVLCVKSNLLVGRGTPYAKVTAVRMSGLMWLIHRKNINCYARGAEG